MKVGVLVLQLVASEVLGLAVGEWFYRLFLRVVPPVAVNAFNLGAAHAMFLLYGIAVGLGFFGWALLASLATRLMGRGRGARAPAAAPGQP